MNSFYGVCVGRLDINGKEIRVGDTVKCISHEKINIFDGHKTPCESWMIGTVIYDQDNFSFRVSVTSQQEYRYGKLPCNVTLKYYPWEIIKE